MSEGTVSGIDGWWGKNSSRLVSLDQCRTKDFPAGLHLIKYRPPADHSYPDEVSLVDRHMLLIIPTIYEILASYYVRIHIKNSMISPELYHLIRLR